MTNKNVLPFRVCVDGVLDNTISYPTEKLAGDAAQVRFDAGGCNCVWVEPDWFRVLADLAAAGVSNADVAFKLNIAPSTVEYTKAGGAPRHSYGQQLLALHRKYGASYQRLAA